MENHLDKAGNADAATSNLQNLGTHLNESTSLIQRKEQLIIRHAEELAANNKTWLSRVMLPKVDKKLLTVLGENQIEATRITLTGHNKSLAAIANGQVAYVKEMVNTLVQVGRAGFKAGADVMYLEFKNNRALRIEEMTIKFYDMIERKLADLDKRPAMIQTLRMHEVELDLRNWEADYKLMIEKFSNVLNESV